MLKHTEILKKISSFWKKNCKNFKFLEKTAKISEFLEKFQVLKKLQKFESFWNKLQIFGKNCKKFMILICFLLLLI